MRVKLREVARGAPQLLSQGFHAQVGILQVAADQPLAAEDLLRLRVALGILLLDQCHQQRELGQEQALDGRRAGRLVAEPQAARAVQVFHQLRVEVGREKMDVIDDRAPRGGLVGHVDGDGLIVVADHDVLEGPPAGPAGDLAVRDALRHHADLAGPQHETLVRKGELGLSAQLDEKLGLEVVGHARMPLEEVASFRDPDPCAARLQPGDLLPERLDEETACIAFGSRALGQEGDHGVGSGQHTGGRAHGSSKLRQS